MTNPNGLVLDSAGNLYIADYSNNRVRKVAAGTGIITTIVGTGSTSTTATSNTSPKAATSTNIGNPFGLGGTVTLGIVS